MQINWRMPYPVTGSSVGLACVAALLGGCGSGQSATGGGGGSVRVLYAGSLQSLMNERVGPAFHRATGYTFTGYPAGSKDLASEIKGRVRQGDVFISASPAVNRTLEGSGNGGWISWYAPFASTSLELGYNASSSYAALLRRGPWYRALARPGIRLGLTDPKLDPKGLLAVAALHAAAAHYTEPVLRRLATDQSNYFPEQDLVGRLQAGQLDAGFFYTVEASAAHIPAVAISPVHEQAEYTLSVLHRAPDPAGAVAFVKFLLGPRGRALLREAGLVVARAPTATGSGVPANLSPVVRRSS